MKRVVLTFGLIAGAILAVVMVATMPFIESIDHGEIIGYTTMVLAFLLVYFGIRSYRDNVSGGTISFGRAFAVGILIVLIASACYVATWEVIYYNFMPDFMDRYAQRVLDKARASGASAAQIAEQTRQLAQYAKMYKNPIINIGMTFVEVFPVGFVMTLVSAAMLRRRSPGASALGSAVPASAP
jgi:uncharacterized protein DUF4199